jgi:hypothetical protein
MNVYIDTTVYSDEPAPRELVSLAQKADYVHRVIAAFDFGLPPDAETLQLFSTWRDVFDTFPLAASPGYHALRSFYGWPPIDKDPFSDEPPYLRQDSREGRTDGCEDRI